MTTERKTNMADGEISVKKSKHAQKRKKAPKRKKASKRKLYSVTGEDSGNEF